MSDQHLRYTSRLGHHPSRLRLVATPIITVLTGSLATILPVIAQTPVMPPFGLMILLAWRLLRPELWRAWIGVPLGLFDDMLSGQPIGSAIFLWTTALIAIDYIEPKLVWRDYRQDWLIAAFIILFVNAGSAFFVSITGGGRINWELVGPLTFWSVLLFPFVARQCARIDRWRLMA